MTLIPARRSLIDGSIASSETTIAAGAAGWVDTDLSAVLGTDNSRVWVVDCIHTLPSSLGVRTPGDATDPKYVNNHTRLVKAALGHLEFYRDGVNPNYYHISGYIQ